jgi:hypothetical protein
MNDRLAQYARAYLIRTLAKVPSESLLLFKRMYAGNDMDKSIADMVAVIPTDKLDWAITQVDNTPGVQDDIFDFEHEEKQRLLTHFDGRLAHASQAVGEDGIKRSLRALQDELRLY